MVYFYDKEELRKKALKEIEKVNWIPSSSRNRIRSMVLDRPDWCVSRQRSWGVPITIFIDKKTFEPLINKNLNSIERIRKFIILDQEFSYENGLMTQTMKIKRKKVLDFYIEQINKLYGSL